MKTPVAANTRNLIAACAAITVFGFAFGMSYPLLSLILESRGVSSDMIGINSVMMPIGILLISPVIPVSLGRLKHRAYSVSRKRRRCYWPRLVLLRYSMQLHCHFFQFTGYTMDSISPPRPIS